MQKKLTAGFAALIVVFAVVGLTAAFLLSASEKSLNVLVDQKFRRLFDLVQLRRNVNAERLDVSIMLNTPRDQWGPWQNDLNSRSAEDEDILRRLETEPRDDATEAARMDELIHATRNFTQIRETQVLAALQAGRVAEARTFFFGVQTENHLKAR